MTRRLVSAALALAIGVMLGLAFVACAEAVAHALVPGVVVR